MLLPFLRQEGDVFFQQDNAPPHAAATTQRTLRGVGLRQLPWPARSPDLSPIEHEWNMMKRELTFLQSLSQPLPNCDNGCKRLGTIYSRMTFGTCMTVCMREYMPALLPERVHCVLIWVFGYPLLWRVSLCLNLSTPTMIKLPLTNFHFQYNEIVLENAALFLAVHIQYIKKAQQFIYWKIWRNMKFSLKYESLSKILWNIKCFLGPITFCRS